MKSGFKLGELELIWLNGGRFELDGGAMFGVVPKILWSKKYPSDADNFVPMAAYPILVRSTEALCIIESGLGNKLNEKQRRIFRVKEEWSLLEDLIALGIRRDDIDCVILTHYDFDHSGGVIMRDDHGGLSLTFPRAKHIIQRKEWEDVLNPNRRSVNSYWPINYEILRDSGKLELTEGDREIIKGVRVVYTGGHNRGHQIVMIESNGEKAIHPGDLIPTHAHYNPLWVMAYDNFPVEVIEKKEAIESMAIKEGAWLTFYHDPFVLAGRFDEKGGLIEKW